MKVLKLTVLFLGLTFLPVAIFVNIDLEHNAQGESCEYVGYDSNTPKGAERTFVKIGFNYVPYDPEIHKDARSFFIQYEGKDIHASNWRVNDNPCVLTQDTIEMFWKLWLYLFVAIAGPVFLCKIIAKLRGSRDENK